MPDLKIASQWPEGLNAKLRDVLSPMVPNVSIIPVKGWDVPSDVEILLANADHGDHSGIVQPPAWPRSIRMIQLISSGTDGYPDWVLAASGDRYQVATSRGTSAVPMAEFVLAAIFAHAKRLPELWVDGPADWHHVMLDSVAGSRLGLFGFGALGQEVARRALAVGMTVSAMRRSVAPPAIADIEMVGSLHELIASSDHLVLLAPATEATRHVINAKSLQHARPNLHLINVARGSLVDQEALLSALDSGRIARATLDVTDPEPLPAGHALYTHPRVKISPHTSVVSPWVFTQIVSKAARNIRAWQAGEPLEDVVEHVTGARADSQMSLR